MANAVIDLPRFKRKASPKKELANRYSNILFFPGVRCATSVQKAKTFIHSVLLQQESDEIIALASLEALMGYLNVSPGDIIHALEELKSWGYEYDVASRCEPVLVWDGLEEAG